MLKVLIADDEQKVCQLIVNIIDWNAFGFEIVGVVNDGLAAYKFLQEHSVDLMLTDIRMPGCDGMELIQKAQVLNPHLYFIIISGYSQFDYAQQAIRFGVEDYLLKPIRKKDLMAALKKIMDRHQEEVQDNQKRVDFDKLLKENTERIKRSLVEDILKKPEKFGGFFRRQKVNEDYHYQFTDDCYLTILVKVLPVTRKEDVDTRRLLLQKGKEVIEEYTEGIGGERVLNIVDDNIYGIFNGAKEDIDKLPRRLKKAKFELMRFQDIFEEIHSYIALGKTIDNFQDILVSLRQAEAAMQGRFYYGEEFLLEAADIEDGEETGNQIIDNTFKKHFLSYIETMDLDNIELQITSIQKILESSTLRDGSAVATAYKEILSVFYFGTHSYNIIIPDQYNELLEQLELYGTIGEVFSHLKDYMIKSLKHWMEEKKYVESKPIRVAKQYIAQNYFRPLTLEIVSSEIGFNPTYFSGVFKKETDMNFSAYLVEVRIENAKNMLLNSKQTVEDISIAVGYSDIKYFSRLFKKMTGVTPTEFRRLYN